MGMLLNCRGGGGMSVWRGWVDAAFEPAVALVSLLTKDVDGIL
jgi:hypothetical protein